MDMHTPAAGHDGERRRNLRALIAALLAFGSILLFMSSCGGDLVFPGQFSPTATAVFTATPVPTSTP